MHLSLSEANLATGTNAPGIHLTYQIQRNCAGIGAFRHSPSEYITDHGALIFKNAIHKP